MKFFCHNPTTDLCIDSRQPIEGDCDLIVSVWDQMIGDDQTFFGVENPEGQILQFHWETNGGVSIDIPQAHLRGSRSKTASQAECRAFLEHFVQTGELPSTYGFAFNPWTAEA